MAISKKTKLMSTFYQECLQKGYTDMRDSTQSLKAKVIANDLGLNYGDIIKFYNKAKECYELDCAEKAEQEKKDAEQKRLNEEEQRRRAVNGEWLLTMSNEAKSQQDSCVLNVYIRPDKSIYSILNYGAKIEGIPTVQPQKATTSMATYHPSQAVYTGATVGGITTGGIHYTKDGYSFSKSYTGKGEIIVKTAKKEFTVQLITMSKYTNNIFKHDLQYKKLVNNSNIHCYQETEKAKLYHEGVELAIKNGNFELMTNSMNMLVEERRLPYHNCREIANLIDRIVRGQFPDSDEKIYETADALSKSNNSADLKRAIDKFNSIHDFRDAKERAKELQPKYEEVFQYEKEQAVLRKEAAKKEKKWVFIIVNMLVTTILVIMAVVSWTRPERSFLTSIFLSIAAFLSIPGTQKLIFKKKYNCLQKILRWSIILVVALAPIAFSMFGTSISDTVKIKIPEAYTTHLADNVFENDGRTLTFTDDACVTYQYVNGVGEKYEYTYDIKKIKCTADTVTMDIALKEFNNDDIIEDNKKEKMTYNILDDTLFYYFTYHKV